MYEYCLPFLHSVKFAFCNFFREIRIFAYISFHKNESASHPRFLLFKIQNFLRNSFIFPRIFLELILRSIEDAVGFVFLRFLGTSTACTTMLFILSKAMERLRSWNRSSCASTKISPSEFILPTRRLFASVISVCESPSSDAKSSVA